MRVQIFFKKIMIKIYNILIGLFFLLTSLVGFSQNVGINATGAAADPSALLDLTDANKGFLITRADTANIASPAFGLMTLAPLDTCLYLYNGIRWMGLGGGGKNCVCNKVTASSTPPPTPAFPCGGTVIPIVDVVTATGKTWMDRNLGAGQVATATDDNLAYGNYYQWGRCSDGHEDSTSAITATNATTAVSNGGNSWDGMFISETSVPRDWLTPQDDNLWQGVNGVNNPCPTGYRLPSSAEFEAERLTWSSNDAAGAFGSALKLTITGRRNNDGLMIYYVHGRYWTSNVSISNPTEAEYLYFNVNNAYIFHLYRAMGFSVRCIKD